MSLITLNSGQQSPSNFRCHLPSDGISLPPKAQISLQRFTHVRFPDRYVVVQGENDKISFMLGPPPKNGLRTATLTAGVYSGAAVGLEVQRALNEATLREQWVWAVTFTAAVSPNPDIFTAAATLNVTVPASSRGEFTAPSSDYALDITSEPANTIVTQKAVGSRSGSPVINQKGIYTYQGEFTTTGLQASFGPSQGVTQKFGGAAVGLCSHQISNPTHPNVDLRFDPLIQDVLDHI